MSGANLCLVSANIYVVGSFSTDRSELQLFCMLLAAIYLSVAAYIAWSDR